MSNFNSRSFSIGGDLSAGSRVLENLEKELTLKDAIIDLYLNVKIRNSDDVSSCWGLRVFEFKDLILIHILNMYRLTNITRTN
jgi:hypothetical protein